MKVAVVTSFPRDPASPHGGVEAVSVNLVRALAKRGDLEVHVVTVEREAGCHAMRSPGVDVGMAGSSVTNWEGATIHRLPGGRTSLLAFSIGRGRRQVQSYLAGLRPDVVHAHDFYGIMVKGLPLPRVFTIHGFIHEDTRYQDGRCPRLRSWLWRWFEVATWADMPHIVSISPYVRERLRGIVRGIIHDIENPIAPECFHVTNAEVPGTIFSAAAICKRKNTLGLAQAFAQLAQSEAKAQLRLAGTATDPAYHNRVLGFIDAAGLSHRITLLGPISAAQVHQELGRASTFALVSFEEGAPMGIAEAMAASVPVVTSNCCGMPYMIRNDETGFLVDPNQPLEVAQRLRELVVAPDLRHRMGLEARRFAQDRFHPDCVAKRTASVYLQAAGQPPI